MSRLRLVTLALAVLAPLSALGTVVLSLTIEELTARAPLVVHGTVHATQAGWNAEHTSIWTWTEVVVTDTLKGQRLTTVLVKQPGGVLGEFGMQVAGAARFAPGEEVVLFLEPATDERGAFVPVSMSASKVTLEDRFGARLARRDLSGLAFARPGQKGVLQPVDEKETLGTAEAFLARVKKAAKGGAR